MFQFSDNHALSWTRFLRQVVKEIQIKLEQENHTEEDYTIIELSLKDIMEQIVRTRYNSKYSRNTKGQFKPHSHYSGSETLRIRRC